MTRLLALWLPTLPTDRIRRREAVGADPLVTVAAVKGAQRLAAVDAAAAAARLRPGMPLADARAICRPLTVRPADPAAEAATLGTVGEWCLRFTPIVALDPPDGLTLDVTGAAHLFGGEAALRFGLVRDLGERGFQALAAVADTAEAAWALARHSTIGVALSGPEALLHLAHPLPLAALRLDPAMVTALAQAGFRTIGDLLDRPRAPVAARFGVALMARLDALLGWTRSPIAPIAPVPPILAERRFAQPIATVDAVEASLARLGRHLCAQLERAQKGARRIELTLFRVDGAVKRLTVGTGRPTRDPAAVARLFHEKLESLGEDGLDTGYGFDVMRLGAAVTEGLTADQVAFEAAVDRAAEADLAALVDRLGARLGVTRVLQLHD
ncbi:MAG: DNA polymerase Y family protein, partial [Caulobacteraceae bacterium]|nr:DNA polymerase Y family protein [Caulobacter sp.]